MITTITTKNTNTRKILPCRWLCRPWLVASSCLDRFLISLPSWSLFCRKWARSVSNWVISRTASLMLPSAASDRAFSSPSAVWRGNILCMMGKVKGKLNERRVTQNDSGVKMLKKGRKKHSGSFKTSGIPHKGENYNNFELKTTHIAKQTLNKPSNSFSNAALLSRILYTAPIRLARSSWNPPSKPPVHLENKKQKTHKIFRMTLYDRRQHASSHPYYRTAHRKQKKTKKYTETHEIAHLFC